MMQKYKIGFMQGRLSPKIDGRIQSFPWEYWRNEFVQAEKLGLDLMEWTLDQYNLYKNPLLSNVGQGEIIHLCKQHAIKVPSLTGDCFMQAPFWKASGERRIQLKKDFIAISNACIKIGIKYIVVPLVDNGRLESRDQEDQLVEFLQNNDTFFVENNLKVIFESDYPPNEVSRFVTRLSDVAFGINYDTGNSASLGYSPEKEFEAYGHRIMNVHIKDRVLGGSTVALGAGNVNFEKVFEGLMRKKYKGNYILQTARADDDDHATPLANYRDMVSSWIDKYEL